jgi:hypothetical protein
LRELIDTLPALEVEGIELADRICDTDDSARDVVEIVYEQGQLLHRYL